MARTVGIGLQDFGTVIANNCFYVDKTSFIREWWENQDAVTLITRPRRFGKTLTMSMLEYFFSVKYAGRSDLFAGLDIWKDEKYRTLQGTYPVISLSLAIIKETNYSDTRAKLRQIITDLYAENAFLLGSGILEDSEKNFFKKVSADMDDSVATMALHQLSKYLSRYYGKKAIIILDEYDTPMQEAYVYGYWDELVHFTRSLFNATFKTNPYLERAIMTGITRVSKESIFSDLNNLKVVTTTSRKYETAFGFTEKEVFDALEEFGMQDQKPEVKKWYDGFKFGDCNNIYNPWSVTNFLDERTLKSYWVNTSSNSLADKLIREGSKNIKLIMEDLLSGNDFCTQIEDEMIYSQLEDDETAIWSLFVASGYLKVAHYSMNADWETEYTLTLTNREVTGMFRKMAHQWFAPCRSVYNIFLKALLSGDKQVMNDYMNKVALATFSSFDSGTKPSEDAEPERFYHGFVLGLMVDLDRQYAVTSNRESGFGRYDVLFEPRDKDSDGIILEFKVYNQKTDDSLEDTAKNALIQIVDKKYAATLESKGVLKGRIRIYGFAFKGKEVLIDGGYINDYEVQEHTHKSERLPIFGKKADG